MSMWMSEWFVGFFKSRNFPLFVKWSISVFLFAPVNSIQKIKCI